jgi:hypothetical protein
VKNNSLDNEQSVAIQLPRTERGPRSTVVLILPWVARYLTTVWSLVLGCSPWMVTDCSFLPAGQMMLLQLKAFTLVEEPLDIDRRMKSHIHHTHTLWAARYIGKMRAINSKPYQKVITFSLGKVETDTEVNPVQPNLQQVLLISD